MSRDESFGSACSASPPDCVDTPTTDIRLEVEDHFSSAEQCVSCCQPIVERQLVRTTELNNASWHVSCLRCCVCNCSLDGAASCFFQAGRVYCNVHRLAARCSPSSDTATTHDDVTVVQCGKCLEPLTGSDWVRHVTTSAGARVLYHLACFTCSACDEQLATGDECGVVAGKLLCRRHYLRVAGSEPSRNADNINSISGGSDVDDDVISVTSRRRDRRRRRRRHEKPTRSRTSFSVDQLAQLDAELDSNPSPDATEVDRIADRLGLTRRTVQIWFQNARARLRKRRNQQPPQLLLSWLRRRQRERRDEEGVSHVTHGCPGDVTSSTWSYRTYGGRFGDNVDVDDDVTLRDYCFSVNGCQQLSTPCRIDF